MSLTYNILYRPRRTIQAKYHVHNFVAISVPEFGRGPLDFLCVSIVKVVGPYGVMSCHQVTLYSGGYNHMVIFHSSRLLHSILAQEGCQHGQWPLKKRCFKKFPWVTSRDRNPTDTPALTYTNWESEKNVVLHISYLTQSFELCTTQIDDDMIRSASNSTDVDVLKFWFTQYDTLCDGQQQQDGLESLLMLMEVINKGSVPYCGSNNNNSTGVYLSDILFSFMLEKYTVCDVCGLRSP